MKFIQVVQLICAKISNQDFSNLPSRNLEELQNLGFTQLNHTLKDIKQILLLCMVL